MLDVEVIDDPAVAVVALDPVRSRLLAALAEPGSAATLAPQVGLTRQKVNYHLRALEARGLVRQVAQRRWGGLTERLLVATAASYVISPSAMGEAASDPARTSDRLSARYLVALAARIVREVGDLARRAEQQDKRLATLALDTEIRFSSAAARAAFTDDLAAAVTSLVSRYHDGSAASRPYRLMVAAHPLPHTPQTRGAAITTPSDDDLTPRSLELEIEVPGTPEQVWEAIATGPGITAWLHHTEVEEREGGRYAFDQGGGLNESGVVSRWDPPRRFATEGVQWQPAEGGPAARLATEWIIEARDDGTCTVRMVMSGFGTGAAWDDEIDGLTEGMGTALSSLRSHLVQTSAAGSRSPAQRVLAGVAVADLDAALPWYERLLGRPADDHPMDGLAEWHITSTAAIQLVLDPERAGRALLTLDVNDLKERLALLAERGLTPGPLDDTTSDKVLFRHRRS